MAIRTRGEVGVPGLSRQTVSAGIVAFAGLLVAPGAIHQRHRPVVVGMRRCDVCVATDTTIGRVDRRREFGLIHEQRYFPTRGVGGGKRLDGVAVEAVGVLHRGGIQLKSRQRQGAQRGKDDTAASHSISFAANASGCLCFFC